MTVGPRFSGDTIQLPPGNPVRRANTAYYDALTNPVLANVVSVCVATIPNYLLNRYWVWQKSGSHSITREIAPFWVLAFMGLVLSSLLVWIAAQFTDQDWVFLAVNLVAFGTVWVLKFFVIERFLFGAETSA